MGKVQVLDKEKIISKNILFELFNYKLCCFLNTRNKARRWKYFSYVKWEEDVFDLNLRIEKTKLDLIHWFDNLSDFEERKTVILKSKFTYNDIECIKILLSRFGYMFRINKICSDKDYRLFYFVLQLINVKNDNIGEERNDLMTSLCQQFLCELFMSYEDFSRFIVNEQGIFFETENIGHVNLISIINLLFFDNGTESSHALGQFYLSLIDFLFVRDGRRYQYYLCFNDKNEKFIHSNIFIDYLNDKEKQRKLFSLIEDILNPLQSSSEIFVSNMLIMNYIFYFFKDEPSGLLKIKAYLDNDEMFFHFFEAIIKRRLIIGKQHFYNLGLENYLIRIKLNETHFYNILSER
ncbi:hypothetical protein KTP48_10695 [Proteus mirabilis]|uniref:hypothetical protein n=1 Tax=Proteus mirabilis TaxID=584 RepID=UPI001C2BABA0|nr:hypothetical protein [Proteus mirabilis]MBU9979211.1 hypothetical protein [Proteus mirabilis]